MANGFQTSLRFVHLIRTHTGLIALQLAITKARVDTSRILLEHPLRKSRGRHETCQMIGRDREGQVVDGRWRTDTALHCTALHCIALHYKSVFLHACMYVHACHIYMVIFYCVSFVTRSLPPLDIPLDMACLQEGLRVYSARVEQCNKQRIVRWCLKLVYSTTQHNTTQHNTSQHNTTQRNATQRNATQHNATQRNTTQHNSTHQL